MKKGNRIEDKRLLGAIDYIDDRFIAEAAQKIKQRSTATATEKTSKKKHFGYLSRLAACLIIMGAVLPIVTYLLRHYADHSDHPAGTASPPAGIASDNTSSVLYADDTSAENDPLHDGSKGLIYQINNDGTSYTLVSRGSCSTAEVHVASTYDGLPVTAIGDLAFANFTECELLIIPETVTSIGIGAFKDCKNLESCDISDTVERIGANAFENCISLNTLFLPDSLEVIESGLFKNCTSLRTVEARNKLKRIDAGAFDGCTALSSLNFNGTKSQWESVSLDNNWNTGSDIRRIDANSGSFSLTPYVGSDGLKYKCDITATVLGIGSCKEKDIVIADRYRDLQVCFIGKEAFADCTQIESVKIPDIMWIIEERAFAGCTNLTDVYYQGTIDEWQYVVKEADWNKDCPFTVVHCLDGDVSVSD
ncbi:MAG: leucine-rich repeat protein [Clostridia bacterium]|nr:leucine-rich repeat protein [Clostridia bacterium]